MAWERMTYLTEVCEVVLSKGKDDEAVRKTARKQLERAQLIVVQQQSLQQKKLMKHDDLKTSQV